MENEKKLKHVYILYPTVSQGTGLEGIRVFSSEADANQCKDLLCPTGNSGYHISKKGVDTLRIQDYEGEFLWEVTIKHGGQVVRLQRSLWKTLMDIDYPDYEVSEYCVTFHISAPDAQTALKLALYDYERIPDQRPRQL